MGLFDFLFANRARDGCSINHDTLIPMNPQAREKFIFYFIAQQLPTKLSAEDRLQYQSQKHSKVNLPRTMLMLGGLLGPLSFALYANKGQFRLPVRSVGVNLAMGVILMSLASSTFTNLSEGRFIDQNGVVDELSKKYRFGIYDFSVAKKESQIIDLMDTMDKPYHQE